MLLQSFGTSDNYRSNQSSRLGSKKREFNSPQLVSECESNSRMVVNSSRQMIDQDGRMFQEHYQNMEKILIEENLNLKQHNNFLTT